MVAYKDERSWSPSEQKAEMRETSVAQSAASVFTLISQSNHLQVFNQTLCNLSGCLHPNECVSLIIKLWNYTHDLIKLFWSDVWPEVQEWHRHTYRQYQWQNVYAVLFYNILLHYCSQKKLLKWLNNENCIKTHPKWKKKLSFNHLHVFTSQSKLET